MKMAFYKYFLKYFSVVLVFLISAAHVVQSAFLSAVTIYSFTGND